MNVLMLSSSRANNAKYLVQPKPYILEHLGEIKNDIVFIPYAGVSINWDDYFEKVKTSLPELTVKSIHQFESPQSALEQASAIMVGGGNTFSLLNNIYERGVFELIKQKVHQGIPYIGWSAGSNICGLSIKTTNDMPIIEPRSFRAFGFINAQINPHYTDYVAPGHNGETRDERIAEFCKVEPSTSVIGIREGSALQLSGTKLRLMGTQSAISFLGANKTSIEAHSDLSYLISKLN